MAALDDSRNGARLERHFQEALFIGTLTDLAQHTPTELVAVIAADRLRHRMTGLVLEKWTVPSRLID